MTKENKNQIEPGIYHQELSNEEYHAASGISKSGLDLMAKSPILYKAKYLDGVKDEPTAAMVIGSAVHKAILEPDDFDKEFVVAQEINKRTKAGKAEWAAFQEDNAEKDVLAVKDYDTIMEMADSVHKHHVAAQLLTDGVAETSIFHQDEETEELVKVRPDWIRDDLIVDVKTTIDASPDSFSKSCFNFRYFVQAPFYLDIASAAYGREFTTFLFIAVEKKEPYQVAVYYADPEMIELGRAEYRRNLDLYSWCRKHDQWDGYNGGQIAGISLPYWAEKAIEKGM